MCFVVDNLCSQRSATIASIRCDSTISYRWIYWQHKCDSRELPITSPPLFVEQLAIAKGKRSFRCPEKSAQLRQSPHRAASYTAAHLRGTQCGQAFTARSTAVAVREQGNLRFWYSNRLLGYVRQFVVQNLGWRSLIWEHPRKVCSIRRPALLALG